MKSKVSQSSYGLVTSGPFRWIHSIYEMIWSNGCPIGQKIPKHTHTHSHACLTQFNISLWYLTKLQQQHSWGSMGEVHPVSNFRLHIIESNISLEISVLTICFCLVSFVVNHNTICVKAITVSLQLRGENRIQYFHENIRLTVWKYWWSLECLAHQLATGN